MIPRRADPDFYIPEVWFWFFVSSPDVRLSLRVYGERMLAIRDHRLKLTNPRP